MRFLLFASYLPSVINFRSELINSLQVHSCDVDKVNTITKDIVFDHYNNKFNPFAGDRQLLSKYY